MGEKKRLRTVEWKRQQMARSVAELCKLKRALFLKKKTEEDTNEPGPSETSE